MEYLTAFLISRQGTFHIDEMVRECDLGAQAIVRRNAHPSARRQPMHERLTLLVLLSDHPAAPVHLQQHGTARAPIDRPVHVEPGTARLDSLETCHDAGTATP